MTARDIKRMNGNTSAKKPMNRENAFPAGNIRIWSLMKTTGL